MALPRHAVVFIHGLDGLEAGAARDRLVRGLVETTRSAQVMPLDEDHWISGHQGRMVQVDTTDGRRKMVEVYEAYWGDLIPASREDTPLKRLIGGTGLLVFWLMSPYRKLFREGGLYFIVIMLLAVPMLLVWYIGLVLLAVTSLGTDAALPETLQDFWIVEKLQALATPLGNWEVWAVIVALVGLLPQEKLVDMARTTRLYLQNAVLPGSDIGLRDRIRFRVQECLRAVLGADGHPFDRVIVVAHSVGAVIGTDLFTGPMIPGGQPVHYVTLGPPLQFLAHKSPWLRERLTQCLEEGSYATWVDFHSSEDQFSSAIPGFPRRSNQRSVTIDWSASLWDRLSGETHRRYPVTQQVAELLVDHPGERLQLPWEREVVV